MRQTIEFIQKQK